MSGLVDFNNTNIVTNPLPLPKSGAQTTQSANEIASLLQQTTALNNAAGALSVTVGNNTTAISAIDTSGIATNTTNIATNTTNIATINNTELVNIKDAINAIRTYLLALDSDLSGPKPDITPVNSISL